MNFFYNFDEKINNFIYPISDSITGLIFWEISFFQNNLPLIVVWLVLASIFFTFYFRFINISAFSLYASLGESISIVTPGSLIAVTTCCKSSSQPSECSNIACAYGLACVFELNLTAPSLTHRVSLSFSSHQFLNLRFSLPPPQPA